MKSAKALIRIVLAYVVASFVASMGTFLIAGLMSIGQPSVEGSNPFGYLAGQLAYIPVFAVFAGVLAAPIALVTILISEIRKITGLWFFLLAGAAAGIPVMFRGDQITLTRAIEDYVTLGPIGAAAGGAFWLVRHRKWPV